MTSLITLELCHIFCHSGNNGNMLIALSNADLLSRTFSYYHAWVMLESNSEEYTTKTENLGYLKAVGEKAPLQNTVSY